MAKQHESGNHAPTTDFSRDRRAFLQGATAGAAALALPRSVGAWPRWTHTAVNPASSDLDAIRAEIEKRHDESVKRLQDWIRQPSIAAENRGVNEGCDLTMRMLRDAGFGEVTKIPTDGQPGIFAARPLLRRVSLRACANRLSRSPTRVQKGLQPERYWTHHKTIVRTLVRAGNDPCLVPPPARKQEEQ